MKDYHIIEALGKTEVIIENGEITSVGNPLVDYCPIFDKIDDNKHLTKDFIKWNIEKRIREFGMCTPERVVRMKDFLSFGISEILKTNIELGVIDCVVGVCDGVGTLLMTDPEIIQGVGGRVSALISTTPIPEVIQGLEQKGSVVLDSQTAELNQLEGLKIALEEGYKNIAVTILPSPVVEEIRNYPVDDDVNIYIFVAHTTGAGMDEVKMLFENADIITACASKAISDYADKYEPYYYGVKVPIFCASEDGRRLLDVRLEHIGKPLTTNEYPRNKDDAPYKLL